MHNASRCADSQGPGGPGGAQGGRLPAFLYKVSHFVVGLVCVWGFARSVSLRGVRGQAIAVLSEGGKPPWNLLTYGSVSRAVYAAHDMAPNDANVKAAIAAGLCVDEYDAKLPDDCSFHLRDFYNGFHAGVQVTFTEVPQGFD